MSNIFVKLFGFPATLVHGDTLVLDRWLWLKKQLPRTKTAYKLMDAGCGSGAYSIGLSLRGYDVLGVSFNERNNEFAYQRAKLCKANKVRFEPCDLRILDEAKQYKNQFDLIICTEVIEHILNDQKVINDLFAVLKPGGKLVLTAPYFNYIAIVPSDNGPFCTTEETGWHVRKGYLESDYKRMCKAAGFEITKIDYCSGYFSQKITGILWRVQGFSIKLAWALILPLRIFPVLFDGLIRKIFKWPDYSICMIAQKPKNSTNA